MTSRVDYRSKEAKITSQQAYSTACNNEELSKSRKRRLRKRRLLESLAPSLNGCFKPNPSLSSSLKTKLIAQNSAQSSSVQQSPVIVTSKANEPKKLSPKDSRKRLDKSVSLRTKSTIKSKTLVESPLNQSKANLIKSLEGKALNSLLQTLAPIRNSSQNKNKSSSKFSFHENQINCSDSKVIKDDGVFYFGETKHQLEKLASGLNKTISSNLFKDSFESVQEKEPSKNILFSSDSGNSENCLSTFKFSPTVISSETFTIDNLTSDKQTISFPSTVGNTTFNPDCPSNEICLSESSVQNLGSFQKFGLKSAVFAPCLSNSSIFDSTKIFDKANLSPDRIQDPNLSHPLIPGLNKSEQVSVIEGDNKVYTNTMKSSEEVNKSNKTREEVMLEREAKKAAKMAAKVKHKNPQNNKADNETSNNILVSQKKELVTESSKIDTQMSLLQKTEEKNLHDNSASLNIPIGNTCTKQVSTVSLLKDSKQELAGKSKAELRAERRAKQVSSNNIYDKFASKQF